MGRHPAIEGTPVSAHEKRLAYAPAEAPVSDAHADVALLKLRLARAEHAMRLVRSLRDEIAKGDQTVTLSKRVFVSALNELFDRAEKWMP